MNKIKQFFLFLQEHSGKLNIMVPWFLMTYFVLICFPYIFARIAILNNVFSNSTIAFIFRFSFLAFYALFGIVLMIANRLRIKWFFFIGSILLLLLFVITTFTSPDSVVSYSLYFTGKISFSSTTLGVYTKLVHIARFGGDLVFFFFLLNCYPYCFKNRNQFTYVILPIIVIPLFGLVYTLIFERHIMSSVIDGTLSAENLHSIFHSKNAYGIFLFNGAVASIFVFFSDTRKWMKLFAVTVPIFFAMSYIIDCKLAAICILVLLILTYVYIIFRYFKTKTYISIIFIVIAFLVSIGIILVFTIPRLHDGGIIGKIYTKILDAIKNFNIASFIGRTTEWEMVPSMTKGIYSAIGFSSATGYSLITAYTSINGSTAVSLYDLHNAYVDFYAYHGIIGCCFLVALYFYAIYLICKLFKKNKSLSLMIAIILFVSILFGMAETYRLFLSMSANTFALNFMIMGLLLFELKDDPTIFKPKIAILGFLHRKKVEDVVNEQ